MAKARGIRVNTHGMEDTEETEQRQKVRQRQTQIGKET
jgi:hypothetical protein